MLKSTIPILMTLVIILFSDFIQAAEEVHFITERPKASLYQIENSDEYLFVAHADYTPYHVKNGTSSQVTFGGEYVKGKDSRLFKGPIDDLKELFVCSTSIASTGDFNIITRDGSLSMDKEQWEDNYEHVFNLIHIKKENNNGLFNKIILKEQELQKTTAQKLKEAGLPSTTDLAPKSRLYKVEEQNNYFFVGYKKTIYYADVSGNFKSGKPNNNCHIPREGYAARIFFGEYPQLNEVSSIESYYPGQSSSLGPYNLIGLDSDFLTTSSLNLLKNQWTKGDGITYKLVHIKRLDNEEFYKKIKLVSSK